MKAATLVMLVGALAFGCSGEAGDAPVDEMAEESDALDIIVPIQPVNPDDEHPLCDGETGWVEGDCQTLVYKLATGYCNRYEPCGGL